MGLTFKERVAKFAASKGMTTAQLQKELGLSNAHFQNTTSVSPKVGMKFKEKFADVNIEWLNTGNGSMLMGERDRVDLSSLQIPLLPLSAQIDSLQRLEKRGAIDGAEMILSPIHGADFAIKTSGDDMLPDYPSGTIVIVKKIDASIFIDWGKTYVIDTNNGVILKNLFPCNEDTEKIECRAFNTQYPPFTIERKNIKGWYRVLLSMQAK